MAVPEFIHHAGVSLLRALHCLLQCFGIGFWRNCAGIQYITKFTQEKGVQ